MPSQTSRRIYLIDPPSPFAPVEEWRAFLAELDAAEDPSAPEIQRAIRQAKLRLKLGT